MVEIKTTIMHLALSDCIWIFFKCLEAESFS